MLLFFFNIFLLEFQMLEKHFNDVLVYFTTFLTISRALILYNKTSSRQPFELLSK
jgi:hypothetical protein